MSQAGDVGTQVTLTIRKPPRAGQVLGDPLDLTGASTCQITIRQPSGSLVTPATSFVDPRSSGQIRCTTVMTTFQSGEHAIQGSWTSEAGAWKTSVKRFTVGANL